MRWIFLAFLALCFARASLQTQVESQITAITKEGIEFNHGKDLKAGETGWIYTHTTDYGAIIYQAEVIRNINGKITAKVLAYDTLRQIYLPSPTNKPKIGDKVLFRKLNKHAFLIAPTRGSYEKIKDSHKEVKFLSSDLLLGYLYAWGGFDPTPEFLRGACNAYSVGLLYVVAKNELGILDCQSLKLLDRRDLDTSAIKEPVTPFYSRIEPITTGTLSSVFANKRSRYYFAYFTHLIHPDYSYQVMMLEEKPLLEARELAQKQRAKEAKKAAEQSEREQKRLKSLKPRQDSAPTFNPTQIDPTNTSNPALR